MATNETTSRPEVRLGNRNRSRNGVFPVKHGFRPTTVPTRSSVTSFERRRTPLPEQIPVGLSDRFALEREAQWQAFLARDRLATASDSLV